MLPYLAQGANSAIEDGAVLGLPLGHIKTKDQVPQALKMYERLRKSRGDAIAREAFKQVSNVHRLQRLHQVLTLRAGSENLSTCTMDQSKSLAMRFSCLSSVPLRLQSRSLVDGLVQRFSLGCTNMMLSLWWSKRLRKSHS
jgi:2-polyprenyl-6-methoxyphenol hydroxylase-like FAD-dependent oxidoreductase